MNEALLNGKTISGSINEERISLKTRLYFAVKRCFDVFVSLIGAIFLLPIFMIIKLIYIISGDFTSIFYSQIRIGKNGKQFKLYKIRSMVNNADKVLEELLESDPEIRREWEQNQKLENDPRITKVGKIIRKLSLDEVPQFFNVLKGDMSLIGPRPLVIGELESHGGNHSLYERVKPGITGWWACNGRSATTYEKRLKLEYYYAKNCSLMLDIKCIFLTIKAVLFTKGAK